MSLAPTVRVFVAVEAVDMRGRFDALAGAVRRLGLEPVDGHLYLFLNVTHRRHRDDSDDRVAKRPPLREADALAGRGIFNDQDPRRCLAAVKASQARSCS